MYKQGNDKELISEYYSYLFLKAMNVRTAEYGISRSYSDSTGLSQHT